MDLFKIIVVVVAVVMLILILTLVAFLINSTNHEGTVYPPTITQCPDNWMVDGTSKCIIPASGNLGTLTPDKYSTVPGYFFNNTTQKNTINFSHPAWSAKGMTSQCNKRLWANTYNIVWDTISNYNQC
jgi:hypothetical protein